MLTKREENQRNEYTSAATDTLTLKTRTLTRGARKSRERHIHSQTSCKYRKEATKREMKESTLVSFSFKKGSLCSLPVEKKEECSLPAREHLVSQPRNEKGNPVGNILAETIA